MSPLTEPIALIKGSIFGTDENNIYRILGHTLLHVPADRVAADVRQHHIQDETIRLEHLDLGKTLMPLERDFHVIYCLLECGGGKHAGRGALIANRHSRRA